MDAVSLSLHARGSADAPVPGQVPSFAVSLSELEVARATTIVCWVIPSIFAVIRLHFKICVLRLVKVSDYAMLISWLLFLAHVAMIWLSIIRDTSPGHRDFVSLEAYNYTGTFLYAVCLFLLKASILLQFIEVFAAQHLRDWFFWACHGLIWSTCVWCVVTVPLGLWGCPPFQPDSSPDSSTGSSTRAGDSCVAHPDVMDVCSGVFNTASDVSILILPLTRTWALQMPLRKKLAVSAVFAVGFLSLLTFLQSYHSSRSETSLLLVTLYNSRESRVLSLHERALDAGEPGDRLRDYCRLSPLHIKVAPDALAASNSSKVERHTAEFPFALRSVLIAE
ncbi:hypothetical protein BDW74DRAFT_174906 [Aspergillus multicolor]|uniref:uncharacterized protein n=1 Tax=Aspergillus multicolor TaxID=41759 RepID=UPI003CCC97AD